MQRFAASILALVLAESVHADCELPFAPPEVRATAMTFHHRADELRSSHHRASPERSTRGSTGRPSQASQPIPQGTSIAEDLKSGFDSHRP